jgi:hypothetical protein
MDSILHIKNHAQPRCDQKRFMAKSGIFANRVSSSNATTVCNFQSRQNHVKSTSTSALLPQKKLSIRQLNDSNDKAHMTVVS